MKPLHTVTFLLLIVGGLNWLLLAVFEWEIGMLFGGSASVVAKFIYILVGLSAIFEVVTHKNNCRLCATK